jgi:hypothetical protein
MALRPPASLIWKEFKMPIIKKKKTAKKVVQRKSKALALKAPTKPTQAKIKHAIAYYDCCSQETKKGLKGVKITQICHHCKHNSQKLALAKNQDRAVEKQKIAQA